jgi:hypothetical protein
MNIITNAQIYRLKLDLTLQIKYCLEILQIRINLKLYTVQY